MKLVYILALMILNYSLIFSIELKYHNNTPASTNASRNGWEETQLFSPNGPCTINKIKVYLKGTIPTKDTLFICGDPAEGTLPPTFWVLHYNQIFAPIIFDYNGVEGWYDFATPNLKIDGYQRLWIMHKAKQNGPNLTMDNDGAKSNPYHSWLLNPFKNNSLGGPGEYSLAPGDYLITLDLSYRDANSNNNEAHNPPAPQFTDVTILTQLKDANGNTIKSEGISVVDWNNDGYDDIAIGGNFFENTGKGYFEDVTTKIGIEAGATAWADYDGDGFMDCYAINNGSYDDNKRMEQSNNKLYQNIKGKFYEKANNEVFNLPYPNPSEDFNLSNKYTNDLVHNPYPCMTATWIDYNRDGFPDLFLANNRVGFTSQGGQYAEVYFPDQLWINEGNGKFSNVTKESGIAKAEPFNQSSGLGGGYQDCYGANVSDYNNDGDPDLFIATYRLAPDILNKNNGGNFDNVASQLGVQGVPTTQVGYFGHGMGADWGDINNDGYMDLAVGNLGHPDWRGAVSNPSLVYINNGPPNYNFNEVHQELGIKFLEMNSGMLWADLDNNGWLDLWHGQISYEAEGTVNGVITTPKKRSRIYMNEGTVGGSQTPNFVEKTWDLGINVHGAWTAARIDYDNDGDIDLLISSTHANEGVRLFRNEIRKKGNFVSFRVIGQRLDATSQDGLGSKVTVYSGEKKFFRELMGSANGTKSAQSSFELHFGLGDIQTIDSVIVVYSNGAVGRHSNVKINKKYRLYYPGELCNCISKMGELIQPLANHIYSPKDFQIEFKNTDETEYIEINLFDENDLVYSNTFSGNTENIVKEILAEDLKQEEHTFYYKAINKNGKETSESFKFMVGLPSPPVPTLASPSDKSNKISLNPLFKVTSSDLTIKDRFTLGYRFEVSKSSDFSDANKIIVNTPYKELLLESTLDMNTTYYWRASAVNLTNEFFQALQGYEDKLSIESAVFEFTTIGIPDNIATIYPENGASDIEQRPKYKWQPEPNAMTYDFELSKQSNFGELEVERKDIIETEISFIKKLELGTKYYWRVRGKNTLDIGPWTESNFTVTGDVSVDEYLIENLKVLLSPNPAKDELNINVNSIEGFTGYISIIDLKGKEILKLENTHFIEGVNSYSMNISNLISGTYFVQINSNGRSISTIKFIKN